MIFTPPVPYDPEYPYICKHRWFKIKKLIKRIHESTPEHQEESLDPGHYCPWYEGILVICANCEEQKELWEKENE